MADIIPFPRLGQDRWSEAERAELRRLADDLARGATPLETASGVSDAGDPWFVVASRADGEVLVHVARINGRFVLHRAVDRLLREGEDLRGLLRRLHRHGEDQREGGSTSEVTPAGVAAFVLAAEFVRRAEAEAAAAPQAVSDATARDDFGDAGAAVGGEDVDWRADQGVALSEAHRTMTARSAATAPAPSRPGLASVAGEAPEGDGPSLRRGHAEEPGRGSASDGANGFPAPTVDPADAGRPRTFGKALAEPPPGPAAAMAGGPLSGLGDGGSGRAGGRLLAGGRADDRLLGGRWADRLEGRDGDDVLDGGGGPDQLDGGDGDGVLILRDGAAVAGGAGADRFVIAPGERGSALIVDLDESEGDRVDLGAGPAPATVVEAGTTRRAGPRDADTTGHRAPGMAWVAVSQDVMLDTDGDGAGDFLLHVMTLGGLGMGGGDGGAGAGPLRPSPSEGEDRAAGGNTPLAPAPEQAGDGSGGDGRFPPVIDDPAWTATVLHAEDDGDAGAGRTEPWAEAGQAIASSADDDSDEAGRGGRDAAWLRPERHPAGPTPAEPVAVAAATELAPPWDWIDPG